MTTMGPDIQVWEVVRRLVRPSNVRHSISLQLGPTQRYLGTL